MSIFKKTINDSSKEIGTHIGDTISQNARNSTNEAFIGMGAFIKAYNDDKIQNNKNGFKFYKGNLFEYIEATKFNVDAALKKSKIRAIVTDSVGRPKDPADIEIVVGKKVLKRVQAKFSDAKKADVETVEMLKKHGDKYKGMDLLIRKDNEYDINNDTGLKSSLLSKSKEYANKKINISKNERDSNDYKSIRDNLTDELNYKNISSKGTTIEELKKADENYIDYANNFKKNSTLNEIKCSSLNMAQASFITSGIASSITNIVEIFKDNKELSKALHDVGADAVKGALRGGATGAISTIIRTQGLKKGSKFLSDSLSATVMAGGLIDGGVAIYSFAKHEMTKEELLDSLIDTTVKATSTVLFTKTVSSIAGKSVAPIIPMIVYTTANYICTATREIIRNAQLKIEECERLISLLQASTRQIEIYNKKLEYQLDCFAKNQRKQMNEFLESFNYNLETGDNYNEALNAIVKFAETAGISLQYARIL